MLVSCMGSNPLCYLICINLLVGGVGWAPQRIEMERVGLSISIFQYGYWIMCSGQIIGRASVKKINQLNATFGTVSQELEVKPSFLDQIWNKSNMNLDICSSINISRK